MKIAIDDNGNKIDVSDDIMVNTIDGTHYLLTSKEELELEISTAEWESGAMTRKNATVYQNRRYAYLAESDPFFFKWQAGEGSEEEWRNKRIDIKNKYPKD